MNVGPHKSCRCCAHDRVDFLNHEIRQGETLEALSTKYQLTRSSLHRHRKSHVGPEVRPDGRRTRALRSRNGLGHTQQLEKLLVDLNVTFRAALKEGKQSIVVSTAREIRGILDSLKVARETDNKSGEEANTMGLVIRYVLQELLPRDVLLALARLPIAFTPNGGEVSAADWDRVRQALQAFERGEKYTYPRTSSFSRPAASEQASLN